MKIKNLKLKIIFLGSSKFVIPILEVLQKNFDLALVITTERHPSDPIPSYCTKSKVRCYVVIDFRNKKILQELTKLNADVGVLASFGAILPQWVLNLFPHGIINIHPSLLPKYRGPTPVQTAILNAESVTGVSIIKLDEEVDHGPIIAQTKEEILATDTAESLYKRLFERGANLLPKVLNKYLEGSLKPIPQNHPKATFTKHLNRHDGYLNISNTTTIVMQIDRMIRAYYPWPGVWTKLRIKNQELRIKFLPGKKIQVEGKKPMSYKDFINGYPEVAKNLEFIIQN